MDLADPLVRPDRRPLGRLLPARGVRLRRRDAAAVPAARRARARRDVRVDRPGLGRQRGVAGGRRRRDLRRLPGLVRDDVLGLLPRAAADPRLPDRPRASRSSGARSARARAGGRAWLWANTIGSVGAAFVWGVALANLVHGVPLDSNGDFTGNFLDLFSAYTVLAGLAVVLVFAFHGATYLTLRTTGDLCDARRGAAQAPVDARRARSARAFLAWTVAVAVDRNDKDVFPPSCPARWDRARWSWPRSSRSRGRSGWAFAATGARRDRAPSRRSSPACIRACSSRARLRQQPRRSPTPPSAHYALAGDHGRRADLHCRSSCSTRAGPTTCSAPGSAARRSIRPPSAARPQPVALADVRLLDPRLLRRARPRAPPARARRRRSASPPALLVLVQASPARADRRPRLRRRPARRASRSTLVLLALAFAAARRAARGASRSPGAARRGACSRSSGSRSSSGGCARSRPRSTAPRAARSPPPPCRASTRSRRTSPATCRRSSWPSIVPLAVLGWSPRSTCLGRAVMLLTLPLVPVFMWLIGRLHRGAHPRALAGAARCSRRTSSTSSAGLPTLRAFNRGRTQAAPIARRRASATAGDDGDAAGRLSSRARCWSSRRRSASRSSP